YSFGYSRRTFGVLGLANIIEVFLQTEVIGLGEWQAHENVYAIGEHSQCVGKSKTNFGLGPGSSRWIRNAPMRCHWLARPVRARFTRGIVADSENKIEFWPIRLRELSTAFRTNIANVVVELTQQIECVGMHLAFGLASR